MINLYSDTQTRPTDAMRAAMAAAEVGDEQRREDPTVIALEERVAELLGQEAAVFLPSGTMCNAIAVRLHIRPGGDEMLMGEAAHPLVAEAGGPASISGAVLTVLLRRRRPGIFRRRRGAQRDRRLVTGRQPLRAAPAARVGGADRQPRRRPDLAGAADPRACSTWPPSTDCARTSTARG